MLLLPYLYPGRYFAICVMRGEDGEMKNRFNEKTAIIAFYLN